VITRINTQNLTTSSLEQFIPTQPYHSIPQQSTMDISSIVNTTTPSQPSDDQRALLNAIDSATLKRVQTVLREICLESPEAFRLACEKMLVHDEHLKSNSESKKRKNRYEICAQCKSEYDTTQNPSDACQWHPGMYSSPSCNPAVTSHSPHFALHHQSSTSNYTTLITPSHANYSPPLPTLSHLLTPPPQATSTPTTTLISGLTTTKTATG